MASKVCMSMLAQLECTPLMGLPSQNGRNECLNSSSLPSPSAAPLEASESGRQIACPPAQQDLRGADGSSSSSEQAFNCAGSAGSNEQIQGPGCALSQQKADVTAMAALVVELFTRRLHYRSYADANYWQGNVHAVAPPVQDFVLSCLDGKFPSMHKLMRHSIFAAPIRAAAVHLAHLDDGIGVGSKSSSSRQASTVKDLLDGPHSLAVLARQGVLQLCVPSILRLVEDAAVRDYASDSPSPGQQHGAEASHSIQEAAAEALLRLVQMLPRSLAIQGPLQVWAALQGDRATAAGCLYAGVAAGRVHPLMQAELMQPARLKQLAQAVGLSTHLDSAHAALLSMVCGGTSVAGEPAAGQALQLAIQVHFVWYRTLLPLHHGAAASSCCQASHAWPGLRSFHDQQPDCLCDPKIDSLQLSVWVALRVGPCEEAACAQALADMAAWLPLPVAREHIQAPLLQSLSKRPDVALALISVAGALGGDYAAAHLVPQLLAILCSRTLSSAGTLLLISSTAPCPCPVQTAGPPESPLHSAICRASSA